MTETIVIAAVARNGVIGRDGKLPWDFKEDLEHFKRLTMGYPCIMGERTYISLPIRPLPGRENIVLSFDRKLKMPGAVVKNSLEDALAHCMGKEKVFICGGASVYEQAMKIADILELTLIHDDYDGDTYFPKIDFGDWNLVKEDKKDAYSFATYVRK